MTQHRARIVWAVLRFRVATMLWLFMFIPIAAHHELGNLGWEQLLAALALAASYVCATTVNDIADFDVDRINHPDGNGRPLVSGAASVRDMWQVHAAAAALTLLCAAAVSPWMLPVMGISLVVNWSYSLPPIQLSYRSLAAPVVLTIGYVSVPYLTGLVLVGQRPAHRDWLLLSALSLLFLGRIVLKDFRDRRGDARYGKPTLLLRYGKAGTCAASGACIASGGALLVVVVLPVSPAAAVLIAGGCAALLMMLARLHAEPRQAHENELIADGATIGNAVLLLLLATLALEQQHAVAASYVLVPGFIAATVATKMLIARPQSARPLAYRG